MDAGQVQTRPRLRTSVTAVAVYVAVALLGGGTASGEVFPFFDWDLFSRVPGQTVRAAIYLEPSETLGVDRAVALTESGRMRGQAITASSLARDLWRATERDPDGSAGVVEAIVANHLPDGAAWSLRVERFDPVERFRDGTLETDVVATYVGGTRREVAP